MVSPAEALGRSNEGIHTEHVASLVWDKFKYDSKPSLIILCCVSLECISGHPPDETVGCPRLSQSKFVCHTKRCLKHPILLVGELSGVMLWGGSAGSSLLVFSSVWHLDCLGSPFTFERHAIFVCVYACMCVYIAFFMFV